MKLEVLDIVSFNAFHVASVSRVLGDWLEVSLDDDTETPMMMPYHRCPPLSPRSPLTWLDSQALPLPLPGGLRQPSRRPRLHAHQSHFPSLPCQSAQTKGCIVQRRAR